MSVLLVISKPFERLARSMAAGRPDDVELLVIDHPIAGRSDAELRAIVDGIANRLDRWADAVR
jgi:hypothetical protein